MCTTSRTREEAAKDQSGGFRAGFGEVEVRHQPMRDHDIGRHLGAGEVSSFVVTVLLDEPRVFVSYGSASLVCGEDTYEFDHDAAWADESNGLCGAGVPGRLQLQVGTHTGWVPFRLESHDTEPALDPAWEEVVEVSFTALSEEVSLAGRAGTEPDRQADRQAGGLPAPRTTHADRAGTARGRAGRSQRTRTAGARSMG